jgi:hypothetical protein
MHTSSHARTAGVIGMIGGVLWIISVILQNSLGLFSADVSRLELAHSLLALVAMSSAQAGFLGLLWGQAFRGRLGPLGITVHVLGWGLIFIGGLGLLTIGPAESPLFLVFPIGGNFHDYGYLFIGIAAVISARWSGWQRWIPLIAAVVNTLTMSLPMLLGLTPDGPGMIPELLMGVMWFGIGLAVFSAYRQSAAASALSPASRAV